METTGVVTAAASLKAVMMLFRGPAYTVALAIAVLAGAAALSSNALAADCRADCDADYYSCLQAYEERACATTRSICTRRCLFAKEYGAFAHSAVTDVYGYAFGYETQEGAEQRALSECGEDADDCEIVLWFWNACGALAQDETGTYGTAWGDGAGAARVAALADCEDNGGTGCAVVESLCTGR